jgi:AraC-like DNA-binding protein
VCAVQTMHVFNNVLSGVERLGIENVVLPRQKAKKAFARYAGSSISDLSRVDDSADHSNVTFTYTDHINLEIVFGVSGRAEIAMAGQRYVLAEGEVAIVPPGAAHLERILSRRQSYHLLWLNVRRDRLFIHSAMYSRADLFQVVRHAAIADSAAIHTFENAAEEALSGKPYWINLFRAKLIEGWVRTLRTMQTHGSGLSAAQVQRSTIDKAKAFMQLHYFQELTLDQIAGVVFLSPAYFSSFFSQNEKMTVFEYLHKLRIAEAARLLAKTSLSSKQIAQRVGIPSVSYFCRLFKRAKGCSAQEFRARIVDEHLKIGQHKGAKSKNTSFGLPL